MDLGNVVSNCVDHDDLGERDRAAARCAREVEHERILSRTQSQWLGQKYFFNRRIAFDAGLLFSYGKFTDAKVNGESFSDSSGDAMWSSLFNVGLRMHFR